MKAALAWSVVVTHRGSHRTHPFELEWLRVDPGMDRNRTQGQPAVPDRSLHRDTDPHSRWTVLVIILVYNCGLVKIYKICFFFVCVKTTQHRHASLNDDSSAPHRHPRRLEFLVHHGYRSVRPSPRCRTATLDSQRLVAQFHGQEHRLDQPVLHLRGNYIVY